MLTFSFFFLDRFTCTKINAEYSQCLSRDGGSSPSAFTVSPAATSTATASAEPAPSIGPSHQVGRLPALGWNSWNAYGCDIDESKILAAADAFASLGLDKAGYEYVNIDDCWPLRDRDASTGRIVPDPDKFPNGISGVAEHVHSLGLKLGVYSDAGTQTCAGYPGSLENEQLDATTFAEWGVDYLKYDNCNVPSNWSDTSDPPDGEWYNSNSAIRFRRMTAALVETERPFQLDICIWGNAHVWEWGARVGHSWRMSGDAGASWDYILDITKTNVQHLDTIDFFGHNDMDMMEIGNGDLTVQEQRTHFAIWSFFKSPILLGTDLSKLSSTQVDIIKNAELLAFNQDPFIGVPAKPFTPVENATTTSPPEFYSGRSIKGVHVFIVNTDTNATKTFDFARVPGLQSRVGSFFKIHDMWTGKHVGTFTENYSTVVDTHDTAAFLITKA
ncbi:glycoside hydrolase [Fomes fomentarius]|nr:glycoside hydrolase [Fomes fomentarius]